MLFRNWNSVWTLFWTLIILSDFIQKIKHYIKEEKLTFESILRIHPQKYYCRCVYYARSYTTFVNNVSVYHSCGIFKKFSNFLHFWVRDPHSVFLFLIIERVNFYNVHLEQISLIFTPKKLTVVESTWNRRCKLSLCSPWKLFRWKIVLKLLTGAPFKQSVLYHFLYNDRPSARWITQFSVTNIPSKCWRSKCSMFLTTDGLSARR